MMLRSGRSSRQSNNDENDQKPIGSMPKMPDLKVATLGVNMDQEDDINNEEKLEEKKMAEIIIKLQVAKQRAAENKKVHTITVL